MELFLYNSLTKKKEAFRASSPVKIYVCGPTIYNHIHLGNLRSLIVFDFLVRLLKCVYGEVIYIRNITDIDDKIIKQCGTTSWENFTTNLLISFNELCDLVGLLKPTVQPRVSDHLPEIINYIEVLLQKNSAYIAEDGVYFRISSYSQYGVFTDVSHNIAAARVAINNEKEESQDFALWKFDDKFSYDSPWGKGRPGWHIECSAMSYKYLGKDFHIHGGGQDLKFPHHENEIAQSFMAYGSIPQYWLHNGFLNVKNEKMSKSLNNFVFARDVVKTSRDGALIRLVMAKTHYRQPMDFSEHTLSDSLKELIKIRIFLLKHCQKIKADNLLQDPAFFDDLNTPLVLSNLYSNMQKKKCLEVMNIVNLLGLAYEPEVFLQQEEIEGFLKEREKARLNKDFKKADEILDFLIKHSIWVMNNDWFYV